MTPPRPGTRLHYTDMPSALRDRLDTTLGAPVIDTVTPAGGFGHQLAAAVTLADGRRVFVKSAPTSDPLTAANLHEACALAALPSPAPAPALLGVHVEADWTAVVFEHLDGPHPDLSPSSADPEHIWALLDKLTGEPAPPAYTAAVAGTPSSTAGLHGWAHLAATVPADLPDVARIHLDQLAELEAAWPDLAIGDRVVHGDLRADNMIADQRRGITIVDWAHATRGPACIDAVSLAAQLVLAGHDPADIGRALDNHPAATVHPEAATAFLAALTGHWHRNARRPAPPGAPGLRDYQHRAAAAGLALLAYRIP